MRSSSPFTLLQIHVVFAELAERNFSSTWKVSSRSLLVKANATSMKSLKLTIPNSEKVLDPPELNFILSISIPDPKRVFVDS